MSSIAIGNMIIPFTLSGVDGHQHTVSDYNDKAAIVIIFSCNHCPYVRAWEDRMIQIQQDYAAQGVQFLLISSNDGARYPTDSFTSMQERAREKEYPFPYLYDETQDIARAYGAERTPEVFLFDQQGMLRYHGVIDDNYDDPDAVKQPYLRAGLDAVLAGQTPQVATTAPVGCTIKWK